MIKALEIPADVNLLAFSQYLGHQGVEHRISEEGRHQVLWVDTDQAATLVRSIYTTYLSGQLLLDDATPAAVNLLPRFSATSLKQVPVTLLLILICLLLVPVTFGLGYGNGYDSGNGEWNSLLRQLLFLPSEQSGSRLYFLPLSQVLSSGEVWRFFTPMFLHFGWVHLVFNLLWVWEVGRRIERVNGSLLLILLVCLASLVANLSQFFMSGTALFGGMSGVVFGLLGYSLVWSRLVPERATGLPPGIYIFMLVYLLVGVTGVMDLAGLGKIANGAHLGGLIAGLVLASLVGLLGRARPSTKL